MCAALSIPTLLAPITKLSAINIPTLKIETGATAWPQSIRAAELPALEETFQGSASEEFSGLFCNRPFSEILIRDQNEVPPCAWYRQPLGRLDESQSVLEIFWGPGFDSLRRNMLTPSGDPGCAGCAIKSGHLPTGN